MKIHPTIKELIKYKKKSKIKWRIIASELGYNKSVISRWTNGHCEPIKAHQKIIMKFLNKNS